MYSDVLYYVHSKGETEMSKTHTNEQTGRGVMINSYVPNFGSEIERTYQVSLVYFKAEHGTWAGFNVKTAQSKEQAEEWFAKGVAWANL
jgi:hypothetical protein